MVCQGCLADGWWFRERPASRDLPCARLRAPADFSLRGLQSPPWQARTRSVSSAFETNLAPEHAVDEDEVSESNHDSDQPPDDPNHQAVMSGGGRINGQAVGGIGACGGD